MLAVLKSEILPAAAPWTEAREAHIHLCELKHWIVIHADDVCIDTKHSWMRCQLRHVAVGLYYDVQGVEVLVGVECCLRPCVNAASACHAAAQHKRLDIRMLMLSTKT
jgi:hypothetical protein